MLYVSSLISYLKGICVVCVNGVHLFQLSLNDVLQNTLYKVLSFVYTFFSFLFQLIVLYTWLLTGLVVKKIRLFWLMILEMNSSEAICGDVFTDRVLRGREHPLQEPGTNIMYLHIAKPL